MKEKQKKNKGITLIVLVITIIVLLILAGVTIVTLTGDNGLLGKTSKAKIATEEAEIGEQVKLVYLEWQAAKLTGTTENMDDFMKNRLNSSIGNIYDVSNIGNCLMITFKNNKIYTYNISTGKILDLTNTTSISKDEGENFVGCYSDIDADGTVDGVIFADLLVGNTNGNQWESNGEYTISKVNPDTLRDYYVSKKNHDDLFGIMDVLSPKGSGEDRFYVMQLNDFGSYYWYKNGSGKMIPLVTTDNFGAGRTNTSAMIDKWNIGETSEGYNATKNNEDIWNHIQIKFKEGWFIPSKNEWGAFLNELNGNGHITSSNYSDFGLVGTYMSSSQISKYYVWRIRISNNSMDNRTPDEKYAFRLATTF